jgi:hypothetical protein
MVMRTAVLVLALCGACGGDDDGPDAGDPGIDSALNEIDGGDDPDIDGAPAGGQGPGDFCETLPDNGGPFCAADLDCCNDNVCREPTDCPGAPGFVPCDEASDCNNVCCETDTMTFCTKPSACDDYGGEELP